MCMDEFVKRLYDFMGIYKIFWSQNSDYRYLPIFTDILPIFYRYFIDIFSKIPAQARVLYSRDFSVEKSVFSDFSAKNRRFYRFFPDFSSGRFFPLIFLLCASRKPIFRRNIGRKNRFFVPCIKERASKSPLNKGL